MVSRHTEPPVSPHQEVAHTDHSVSVLPGGDTGAQAGHETRQEDLATLLHLQGEGGGDQDWGGPQLSHPPPETWTLPGLCSWKLIITFYSLLSSLSLPTPLRPTVKTPDFEVRRQKENLK